MDEARAALAKGEGSTRRRGVPCVRIVDEKGGTLWGFLMDPPTEEGLTARLVELSIDVISRMTNNDFAVSFSVLDLSDRSPSSRQGRVEMYIGESERRGIALVRWDRDPERP